MIIYGVAILSACMLLGMFIGDALGQLLGLKANVGGVGIAMIALLLITNSNWHKLKLPNITQSGISFWSAMYIPIVVAMAAKQNVIAALSGGWMAFTAGFLAVVASFALIPVLRKMSKHISEKADH